MSHHDQIHALPLWTGEIAIERLHGGLSNESYAVTDPAGRFVVRFVRDFPWHHVWRDREVIATRAAHAAGFAPELVHHQPGIMVSRFIQGHTYTADDVIANIPKVIDLIRQFHTQTADHAGGTAFIFWVFHVIRDYARQMARGDHRLAQRAGEFIATARALEAVQIPLSITWGHHDFLPANFIDDGGRLWLIDFEYAGYGTAMFDLANLTSNSDMDRAMADEVLGLYFGAAPDAATRQAHEAMECASLLREAMWSMISEMNMETPGVDYVAYSGEILEKTERALEVYQTRWGRL